MTNIFGDGFESGDLSAWTASSVLGTGSIIQAGVSYADVGSYGCRASVDTENTGKRAYARKTISQPGSNTLYEVIRANIRTASPTNVRIMPSWRDDGVWDPIYWVEWLSTTPNLRFRRRDGTVASQSLSATPSVQAWLTWKFKYDVSTSTHVVTLWVDDTQVAQVSDSTSGTFYWPDVAVGVQEWYATNGFEVWFDGVAAYDSDPDLPPLSISVTPENRAYYTKSAVRVEG